MLTHNEEEFVLYWKQKREQKKGNYIFFIKGVRNASIFVSIIMLTLLSGWYKRVPFLSTSLIVTLFVGMFLLVLFIAFFTYQYNYEKNEQRYLEITKKNRNNK